MINTTLSAIRANSPCPEGWAKLLRHLGKTEADDEPLAIATILESNGLNDAIWCLRAVEGHDREIRLFAVWCARRVQHLLTDPRSISALDVAERYANGEATHEELAAAWTAARTARTAAWAAAWAAWTPRAGARTAAWAAAWDAAGTVRTAAWTGLGDAGDAGDAAGTAAWDAAGTAAWDAAGTAGDAETSAQTDEFKRVFCQDSP